MNKNCASLVTLQSQGFSVARFWLPDFTKKRVIAHSFIFSHLSILVTIYQDEIRAQFQYVNRKYKNFLG
jgi:hypothetical protein